MALLPSVAKARRMASALLGTFSFTCPLPAWPSWVDVPVRFAGFAFAMSAAPSLTISVVTPLWLSLKTYRSIGGLEGRAVLPGEADGLARRLLARPVLLIPGVGGELSGHLLCFHPSSLRHCGSWERIGQQGCVGRPLLPN